MRLDTMDPASLAELPSAGGGVESLIEHRATREPARLDGSRLYVLP